MIGLLLLIRRIARGNYADQGYVDKVSGNPSHRHRPRRCLASLNRPLLLQGGTLIATKISAEVQNGVLVLGDAHSVQLNIYLEEASSRPMPLCLFEGCSDQILLTYYPAR